VGAALHTHSYIDLYNALQAVLAVWISPGPFIQEDVMEVAWDLGEAVVIGADSTR
jgi:hypothetical protein